MLYDRKGMSLPELAEKLWQRYGYASSELCNYALWKGFHAEGFRLRTRSEARMCLSVEKRQEIARAMREGRRRAAIQTTVSRALPPEDIDPARKEL